MDFAIFQMIEWGRWCLKINDIGIIKQEILDTGSIHKILDDLGCENIRKISNRFEAQLPDNFNSNNNRSVQVYENEHLTSVIRSRGVKGDIFTLVAYLITENNDEQYLNKQLHKSKIKILDILGWNNSQFKSHDDVVHNGWLKELKEKRSKEFDLSKIEPNPILPETVLNEFIQIPHLLFYQDGISLETQREFEIGFDIFSERITIPIRDKKGNLIGVKARATKEEDENKYKYLPIYSYHKSREWFNLHRAMPFIIDSNSVICFESEKSCLKAFEFGCYNAVSQQGSDITKIQAEILKKTCPDLKIILAYDQDCSADDVKQMAKVFGDYNNLFSIIDVKELLDDKMSPVDKGLDIWNILYNHHCFKIPL